MNTGVLRPAAVWRGLHDRDKNRDDSSNDWTNGSGQYGTLYQTAGCPVQCNPYSFGSQGFNVISMVNLPNFMKGRRRLLPEDPAAAQRPAAARVPAEPERQTESLLLHSYSVSAAVPPFDFALTLPELNPYNSYAVTEKTSPAMSRRISPRSTGRVTSACGLCTRPPLRTPPPPSPVSLWTHSNTRSTVRPRRCIRMPKPSARTAVTRSRCHPQPRLLARSA